VPTPASLPSGHAHDVRALVATADRHIATWAREQLPGAGVSACDEAEDIEGALRLARELQPDLCLLDVALPGDPVTALHSIRELAPTTRVVMLAAADDDPALLPALRAGASGCIIGTLDSSALERTLADVLAGHTAMPRSLLTRLIAHL
jgi:two-component system, NarL family, response regulator DevR